MVELRYSTLSGVRDRDCEDKLTAQMIQRFGQSNIYGVSYYNELEKDNSGKLSIIKYYNSNVVEPQTV